MAGKKEKSALVLYQELNKEVQKNILRPVYLLTGDEDYLIDSLCKNIICKAITPGAEGFDYQKISGQALHHWTPQTLLGAVKQLPFMSPKRVFHFIDSQWFQTGAGKNEALFACLEKLEDDVVLIFQETKIDKKQKKLLDLVRKRGAMAQLDYLETVDLVQWIVQYAGRLQLKISSEAAHSLAQRCQLSMRQIAQEFKKFALYAEAKQLFQIDLQFLEEVSIPDTSGDIFKLTEHLLNKDHQAAFSLLKRLLEQNQAVLLLIFLIAKHIKQLIFAKQANHYADLANRLKLLPFVAKKIYEQAERFSVDELTEFYEECYQADLAIKTGKMTEDLALDFLLTKIH